MHLCGTKIYLNGAKIGKWWTIFQVVRDNNIGLLQGNGMLADHTNMYLSKGDIIDFEYNTGVDGTWFSAVFEIYRMFE